MLSDLSENFSINVAIWGNGAPSELEVVHELSAFVVLLDGIQLCTLIYDFDTPGHWVQIEGNLGLEAIAAIGDAIEHNQE